MPSVHASTTEKGRPASAAGNALLASVCSSAVHRHEVVWWLGWDGIFFLGGGRGARRGGGTVVIHVYERVHAMTFHVMYECANSNDIRGEKRDDVK